MGLFLRKIVHPTANVGLVPLVVTANACRGKVIRKNHSGTNVNNRWKACINPSTNVNNQLNVCINPSRNVNNRLNVCINPSRNVNNRRNACSPTRERIKDSEGLRECGISRTPYLSLDIDHGFEFLSDYGKTSARICLHIFCGPPWPRV